VVNALIHMPSATPPHTEQLMPQPPAILIRDARVLTLVGAAPRRGGSHQSRNLGVLDRADVLVIGDRIARVGHVDASDVPTGATAIRANGKVLMPAFVDCHTHACWGGTRIDEWELKLGWDRTPAAQPGTPDTLTRRDERPSYLELLQRGGGIMSTVVATRQATQATLVSSLKARLARFLEHGTATIEIKSGYGLTLDAEQKMLRAILRAAEDFDGTIVPTALLGHAIDPSQTGFAESIIADGIQEIAREFPGITVDAFCEQNAWSFDQCARLFARARELGLPWRIHADQFTRMGMILHAIANGATSVDHLEASNDDDLRALAKSDAFAVILPICGMHVDGRFANARPFLDAGGKLAIATNFNPGSAPSLSMPLAIALAVRHCNVCVEEAIIATTLNAAHVLGLEDRGMIVPDARADLILLEHTDERALAYELGGNPVEATIVAGRLISRRW
jgi:imidazolonepropionase